MTNYDNFAPFYDSAMGDRLDEAAHIESWIKQYVPQASTLLELACGTGTFLSYFSKRGYNVTGLDTSEQMLDTARTKLPKSTLIKQDMASFSLPKKFDVIICLFDSINHLTDYKDWQQVFSRVRTHLNPQGIFIFDINTQYALDKLTQGNQIVKKNGNDTIIMQVKKQSDGLYMWNLEITKDENTPSKKKFTENILESSFPINQITSTLTKEFNDVIQTTLNGNKVEDTSLRVYFICKSL